MRASGHLMGTISVVVLFGSSAGAAPPAGAAGGAEAVVCTWGGTPAAATGTITITPGLTSTPSAGPLKIVATGPIDCSDGFTGKVTFDGVIQTGGTCAAQVFEGKVKGLPSVDRLFGPGVFAVAHEFFYDKEGNVVGTDQPQVLSGVGRGGSEVADCNTAEGFEEGIFSSTVELWG
jgi:hypothetical protein